jgi:hypothetical protein
MYYAQYISYGSDGVLPIDATGRPLSDGLPFVAVPLRPPAPAEG